VHIGTYLLRAVTIMTKYPLQVSEASWGSSLKGDLLDTITTDLISNIISKKNFVVASRTVFPGEVYLP
jgi:hypothetical protein